MRDKLKKRRIKLGYTQQEVANLVGIARNSYTNIETGKKNPSYNVSLRIKKALGIKYDDIFLVVDVSKRNTDLSLVKKEA